MKKYTHEELKNTDPVVYAKARNEEINANAKAEGWQFWTLLPEDREFYEERDYKTAYDYEKCCAFQVLSDVFKEINGWRPRGMYPFDEMDLASIEDEICRLYKEEEDRKEAIRQEEARIKAQIAAATEGTPLTYNPFAALKGVC